MSDLLDFDRLKEAYSKMDAGVQKGYLEIKNAKDGMIKVLEEDIDANKKKVKGLNEEITSGDFLEVDADREAIQQNLDAIRYKMKECSDNSDKFNGYLRVLNETTVDEPNEDLEKLKTNFRTRDKLWTSSLNLDRDAEEWKTLTLMQMKTANIEDKIRDYRSAGLDLNRELAEAVADKVLEYYNNEQVMEWEQFCPVIVALSSTSMQERHWKDVFKLIGIEFLPESLNQFTLGDIILKLAPFNEDIDTISAKAVGEEKIQKDLEKNRKRLDSNEICCYFSSKTEG